MKSYKNTKRLLFGVLSTLFLLCNLMRAASYFDPLAIAKDKPVCDGPPATGTPSAPCVWPDNDPKDEEPTCGDYI